MPHCVKDLFAKVEGVEFSLTYLHTYSFYIPLRRVLLVRLDVS